ncbi:tripartite tricarboxylate transporter TctB family protein [Halomonas sp. A40-4]|uniref:tripartite tricarboxylate transporter TctB family protein n=1 Tax=Halomonas sp. A40-4 TaxID=2785909 RepID=UPI001E407229|nr:tripartite tricarboxylate transporter TctB family protein [Halomonas sp. A40-4]
MARLDLPDPGRAGVWPRPVSCHRGDRPDGLRRGDWLGAAEPAAGTEHPTEPARPSGRWAAARPLALLVVVCGYGLLLAPLGFHIASFLAVFATGRVFGLRVTGAALLALPLVIGVHLLFYSLLRVPLPWGLLTPLAW